MEALTKYKEVKSSISEYLSKIGLADTQHKGLPYAYPCDNYLAPVLDNKLAKLSLEQIVNRYYGDQIVKIIENGIAVNHTSFPRVYSIYEHCLSALNLPTRPQLIVTSALPGINALSVYHKHQEIILLSNRAAMFIPSGELKFLIGHELGHIAQGNLLCHTVKGLLDRLNNASEILGQWVSDILLTPLAQWHKCSEFTADRAGIICAQNMKDVHALFMRVYGSSYDLCPKAIQSYNEIDEPHPLPHTRLSVLKKFAIERGFDRLFSMDASIYKK